MLFDREGALCAGEGLERVQLCGLLGQMPRTIRLLVGLGFRSFSVEPRLVPHLAPVVGRLEMAEAEVLRRLPEKNVPDCAGFSFVFK
jgi:signal transduction protein with GAF and PtsI domain